MKHVTSRTVAAEAGVSHSTVSRVLNNDPRITAETARRVIAAARQLGYPLTPRSGRRILGVLMPRRVQDSYVVSGLESLIREAFIRRCRVEIIPEDDIELFNERAIWGAVSMLADDRLNREWCAQLKSPLIRFGRRGNHLENIFVVASDGIGDLRAIIGHLTGFGHRRIGFLLGHSRREESTHPSRRGEGFLRALSACGELAPERFVRYGDEGSLEDSLDYLVNRQNVTALLVLPAGYALRVAALLRDAGMRIPQDISFVAWEYPGVTEYQTPPLTALHQDMDGFARAALDLLELLAAGRKPAGDIFVPGRLIERASVSHAVPEKQTSAALFHFHG
ncbi:MAG: LacI family DNA-binding transcriptional regulator [Lentisphaeria bacterium]|nr:LacI family DNA-binding transcriptional regulator [Lentisphaeria bacterium]